MIGLRKVLMCIIIIYIDRKLEKGGIKPPKNSRSDVVVWQDVVLYTKKTVDDRRMYAPRDQWTKQSNSFYLI